MADTTEVVKILIEAEDQATRTLKGVSDGLADVAKPAKGLTKTLGGLGGALSTAIGSFAGGAALNLAAKGFEELTGFVTGGIAGAREAAAGYAQLTAVLASTGGAAGLTADELSGLSGDLSQAAGVSTFADDQVLALENLLLTFTNVKGDIFKEATQIGVDMATALGTEPQAAAVQLGKALNDPIKGISALSRVGVTFTDQQKEQIKTMQEAGDMAGAQSVILAELQKEFGGSAQAAADAAGPQAQFIEQLGEMSEELGAVLLPIMQEFFAFLLSPAVQDGFKALIEGFKTVVSFVSENMKPILAALAVVLVTVVIPAFVAWAAAAGAAALATMAALAPVVLPIAAIAAAVALLTAAWDRDWGGMRTTITSWWTTTVKPIFETVKKWLGETIPKVIGTLKAAWDIAWDAMSDAITAAKRVISGVIDTITSAIQSTIDVLNILIDTINKIPGIHIPSIPSLPGAAPGPTMMAGPVPSAVGLVAPRSAHMMAARTPRTITVNVKAAVTMDGRSVGELVAPVIRQQIDRDIGLAIIIGNSEAPPAASQTIFRSLT